MYIFQSGVESASSRAIGDTLEYDIVCAMNSASEYPQHTEHYKVGKITVVRHVSYEAVCYINFVFSVE